MRRAAGVLRACIDEFESRVTNPAEEVIRGHDTFLTLEHYPPDDVYDAKSRSQYFYHAHRGIRGEHGHFHAFLRADGMPAGIAPAIVPGGMLRPQGEETVPADAIAHLIAVSINAWGDAVSLFAVNRWVAGDTWYAAGDLIRMLDRFDATRARPRYLANRWLTALLRVYRPEIEALLLHRDAVVARWSAEHPDDDVLEDRRLEITGSMRIDVPSRLALLDAGVGGAPGAPRAWPTDR